MPNGTAIAAALVVAILILTVVVADHIRRAESVRVTLPGYEVESRLRVGA